VFDGSSLLPQLVSKKAADPTTKRDAKVRATIGYWG
jgi:hypothetical protein